MKNSIEPFWWGLFGAGGTLSAFVIPVLLILNGLAIPLGLVEPPSYQKLLSLVQHPLTRIFLFVVISLSLLHWAHRFRFTLHDGLPLKHLNLLIAVLTYGMAILLTMIAAFTFVTI